MLRSGVMINGVVTSSEEGAVQGSPLSPLRGVAIFAKACFGHPSPSKQQKLNATANAFGVVMDSIEKLR
jgi:hypothetical protein